MQIDYQSEINEDISIILKPLKSTYILEKELSIDQLTTYLNINKAYINEIVEGISNFFKAEINSIEEIYFYKIINIFMNKLEENKLPEMSFIYKIFPILMDKIYNFKIRKIKDENKLFNTISEFLRKFGNNIGQIEIHLSIIFEKLSKDDNEFDINDKYALITVLKNFLQNSPNVTFYKIMKSSKDFKKIIHNFKNKNKIIRKSVNKLIEVFLLVLFNKEENLRIEQSEKLIYDTCIKEYIDVSNISEFTKHGLILVLDSFAVQNPKNEKQINEFFKERHSLFLDYLYSNLSTESDLIKIAIIRALTKYCKLFPYLMGKTAQDNNFSKILNEMIIICEESDIEEKTNSEALKSIGILSLMSEYKIIFDKNIDSVFQLILREMSVCKTFNNYILDFLSNIIVNYKDKFIEKFKFDLYYEKIFNCGLKDNHVIFLQNLLKLYPKNSKENIQIMICTLNVISFIITQKPFIFKFTPKQFQAMSREIKMDLNYKINSNENQNINYLNNLVLSKSLSVPLNNRLENTDIKKYIKVGKSIKEYIKDKKEKGIQCINDINKAIELLGYINNENLENDILNFYIEKCINVFKDKEKDIKIVIISLGNSSWIPKIEIKKIINMDEAYNLKYIFENYFDCLLVEMDIEIKLLILKIFEDKRYLQFLIKDNYFQKFCSLLECDSNEMKKRTVEIISKLIPYDFNKIHSYIKHKLRQIYKYLETSNNQYKQEKNLILLSYFIKYISKCIEDSLETIFINLLKALKKEMNDDNNIVDKIKNENNFIILDILLVISELMNNTDYDKTQIEVYLNEIMSICIKILSENISSSSLNEETALYTILSILINSNKDWKIYSDYIDLVNLVIDVISKSQNKQSRLYAMEIFGHIGTMNPDKLEILLDLNEVQNENDLDKFLIVDEVNNYSDTEIVYQKNKLMKKRENLDDKKVISKLDVSQSKLSIDIGQSKSKFDFKKAIREKNLNNTTYYTVRTLMRNLLNNCNYILNTKIIKFLKELLEVLPESDFPVIYLILPTLIYSIDNFEIDIKLIILEIIDNTLKTYITQSLPSIENILQYIIGELKKKSKILNLSNQIRIKYMYLSILDNLCTSYIDEISDYYQKIIHLILSLLPDKEEISIKSKRKAISCLNHMGNTLTNFMSIVIPKLTDYMTILINKFKLISYNNSKKLEEQKNKENLMKSNQGFFFNLLSSILPINSSSNIENNNNNYNEIDEPNIDFDSDEIREEKELGKDIINLISFLLDKPGILNYLERIIHTLCSYMEAEPNSMNDIVKIFIRILNNFQDEFLFFFPFVIKFFKKISVPNNFYFDEFRIGLKKNKILELINDNYMCFTEATNLTLPFFHKDNADNYNISLKLLNNNINNIKYNESHEKFKSIINRSFNSGTSENISSSGLNYNNNPKQIRNKIASRNISFESLIKEFETINCITEDDWHEWFKVSSKKIFENSPSYILYLCYKNKLDDSQIINELYNSAFYSLWISCNDNFKQKLNKNLQEILNNPKTPDDILLIILNLIEFINKEENSQMELIEFNQLGEIANICKAHAKALYYAENEYMNNDSSDELKKLINLYIDLELPESALGIYRLAQKKLKTSFYNLLKEKDLLFLLHMWKKAITKIEEHQKKDENGKFVYDLNDENDKSLLIKKALCLEGLSDWENLLDLGEDLIRIDYEKEEENIFEKKNENLKINIPLVLSNAALNLGEWDKLRIYSEQLKSINDDDYVYEENFFKAIVAIKDAEYSKAEKYIYIARDSIDDKIKALLNESYERAYKLLLDNENLCQLEDIIKLNKNNLNSKEYNKKKENLKIQWNRCLELKKEDIKDYQRIIGIRRIILTPEEDYLASLELSQICRKKDNFTTCMLVLNQLKKNIKCSESDVKARVGLAIGRFIHDDNDDPNHLDKAIAELENIVKSDIDKLIAPLKSKIYCYYGMWRAEKIEKNLNEFEVKSILEDLKLSTKYNNKNYKAWHFYALLNYKFFELIKKTKDIFQYNYASNAIEGFIKSICIGEKNTSKIFQDLLLLLNIWFLVGTEESINNLIMQGINDISLENWALVIPQLLTRTNIVNPLIRKTLISLLKKLVLKIPRSLTYPLTVLKMSKSKTKSEAVSLILEDINDEKKQLFKECELVINELNRCALFLHEKWKETIEESAKLFFQLKDIKGAAKILVELHNKMKNNRKTISEIHFYQEYGSDLNDAYLLLKDYLENDNITSFKEAWDIYSSCYDSICTNFKDYEYIDLKNISLELSKFRESLIEIPGIYQNGVKVDEGSVVKISSFSNLEIFNSRQHPRKIAIYGNDGKEYLFLLKGHDDLRQDERVMQLFRLINTLLSKDSDTKEKNLFIKRFPVVPLSHNTGLIGWISNCDTLNRLIKEYRQINNIELNIEYYLMTKLNEKFDSSLKMAKLEAFKYSLYNTLGIDLYRMLWNNSQNAENWLDGRTNYSRSLAVMSIVGYILGLGDRRPSNIMLDRVSGKIIHVDFGDCFEVSMKREKFPEKVPFRLTRMLIKALEIGGIEGTFRITCENVMRVMRENKDSLNVILAAFVHDPLTSFRLLIPLIMKNVKNKNKNEEKNNKFGEDKAIKGNKIMNIMINKNKRNENEIEKKRMRSEERQLYNEFEEKDFIESNDLKQIIKIVLERVSDKLNGTDFNKNEELKISEQVRRLIIQATSHENLSQSYIEWRPFW